MVAHVGNTGFIVSTYLAFTTLTDLREISCIFFRLHSIRFAKIRAGKLRAFDQSPGNDKGNVRY